MRRRAGTADGIGTAAKFLTPVDLALAGTTTLYVADYGGHTLRAVNTTTKAVTTVVGSPTSVGVTLGPLTAAPVDRRSLERSDRGGRRIGGSAGCATGGRGRHRARRAQGHGCTVSDA